MNKLTEYFEKSFPFDNHINKSTLILIPTFWILFALSILRPCGIGTRTENFMPIVIGFTLVTFLGSLAVFYLFPRLSPNFYNSIRWTIGKFYINSLVLLSVITIGNFLFDINVGIEGPSISTGIQHWGSLIPRLIIHGLTTCSLGIVPLVALYFLIKNKHLKSNLEKTQIYTSNDTSNLITLTGNTKDSITLSKEQLYYIKSWGNYVEVYYFDDGKLEKKLLRTSISKIEDSMIYQPDMVRCHRAFIVNLEKINSIQGNSNGYTIILRNTQSEVPVSRSYTETIKALTNKQHSYSSHIGVMSI